MLTIFDISIFTIIAIFACTGLYQGIIGIVIRTVGFVSSLVLAYFLSPYLLQFLEKHIETELIQLIAAGVISYIISLILCAFITHKFLLFVSSLRGGVIDRFFGLLIGTFIGVVISMILFVIVIIFTSPKGFSELHCFEEFTEDFSPNQYSGILAQSLSTNSMDKMCKIVIKVTPNSTLKTIQSLTDKEQNTEKEKGKKFK